MKNKNLAVSVAILSMVATNVMALECPKNFLEVIVTGEVNTQNLNPYVQVGTIDMQLTSVKNGKVLFDQLGAIVGQITGIDESEYPPVVILDHDITFADGVEIETNGDRATAYGDPTTEVDVPVVEVISNFWGSKTFRKATGEITAVGTLNTTGGEKLYNHFELDGSLCIKD